MTGTSARIAFVLGELGIGGAERQILTKIHHLKARGYEPVVIALSDVGSFADAYRDCGVRVHQIPRRRSVDPDRVRTLARILRRENPHIVQGEQYDAGSYARLAGYLAGVPTRILAIRSAYPRIRPRYRISESILKRITTGYIVNAHAIKERTIAFHGVPAERVHVVYNIFEDADDPRRTPGAVRAELGLEPGNLVVGIVASFSPEKRHVLFLEIAAEFAKRHPNARFLLIGDGRERPRIEAAIRRLGIDDRVKLLGLRQDVPDLLQVMDVSVNTSLREGLCNALLESLAAGVPVLATRVGGTPELVREGVHGELFDTGSIADGIRGAERLVAELDAYRERLAADREALLAPFRAETVIQQTVDAYRKMALLAGCGSESVGSSDPGD